MKKYGARAWTERGKEGKEASGGERVQRSEGEVQGGAWEEGKEGNFRGCTMIRTPANIQHALHKTTHNAALALDTLVLQVKNSEHVYYLNSVL